MVTLGNIKIVGKVTLQKTSDTLKGAKERFVLMEHLSWRSYFGTCIEFCSSTILKIARQPIKTVTWPQYSIWKKTLRKNGLIWIKKMVFREDKAPCHRSIKTIAKINKLHVVFLSQSPYSPDLTPCDFYWMQSSKKIFTGMMEWRDNRRNRDLSKVFSKL